MRRSFALIALILVVDACVGSNEAPKERDPKAVVAVAIKGFRYVPDPIRISAGATVTWTNQDQILHTATSGTADASGSPSPGAGATFDGTMEDAGKTFSFTFAMPGTYPYFCRRHSTAMFGRVVVT